MRACRHYAKRFGSTEIVPSNGYPWNAWVTVYQGEKIVFSSFQTGLRWEYLTHLAKNPECRREILISSEEVNRLLREIEEEWQRVT
jgi:hypothetical protein